MPHIVRRPASRGPAADGLFLQSHFQVAYVTTDLERACELLRTRYDLGDFEQVGGEMPTGNGHMKVALSWAGGIMYELIEASGPDGEFYTRRLPKDGFAIRHHHLGYLVESRADWDALHQRIAAEHWTVPFRIDTEGYMSAVYIDAPELGHYLEYIFPEDAGVAFFENIPAR
jgi:hypothetical protein